MKDLNPIRKIDHNAATWHSVTRFDAIEKMWHDIVSQRRQRANEHKDAHQRVARTSPGTSDMVFFVPLEGGGFTEPFWHATGTIRNAALFRAAL